MLDCYDEETHTCDGRCQGCTDCPMAHDIQVSKRIMKQYIKKSIEQKKEWDKFIEELHQDEEFINEVKNMMKTFGFNKE